MIALNAPSTPEVHATELHRLSDRQALAMALGTDDLPSDLLRAGWPDTLMQLAQMDPDQRADALGIGPDIASRISGLLEVHRRLVQSKTPHRPTIKTAADVAAVMVPFLASPVVSLYCLPVNSRGRLLHAPLETSRGDTVSCDLAARPLFRLAVMQGAAAVFVAVVRPDAQLEITAEDQKAVRLMVAAGRAVDVPCRDVLICGLGEGNWRSVRHEFPVVFA